MMLLNTGTDHLFNPEVTQQWKDDTIRLDAGMKMCVHGV